jgi:UDP-N-acetylglucosamine 2-epimerase (non-hydrolysing)
LLETVQSKLKEHIPHIDAITSGRQFILVTGHRRENFGQGFLGICESIKEVAISYPDWQVIYPVHLNPNVQKPVNDLLKGIDNIYLIPPLEYLPFVYLMNNCAFVLTDSGGIQEEAPGLGKPVLVMRDTTERPEAVEAGTVKLVGTIMDQIVENCKALIEDAAFYKSMSSAKNPYGDGSAAKEIVKVLKEKYQK